MRALDPALPGTVLRGAVLGSYVLSNGLEQTVPYYGLMLVNGVGAGTISSSWSFQGREKGKRAPM